MGIVLTAPRQNLGEESIKFSFSQRMVRKREKNKDAGEKRKAPFGAGDKEVNLLIPWLFLITSDLNHRTVKQDVDPDRTSIERQLRAILLRCRGLFF